MLSWLSWNPELRRDGAGSIRGPFFAGSFMFLALSNWISQAVMLCPHELGGSAVQQQLLTERSHCWRKQSSPWNTVSHGMSGVICPHFYFWFIMRSKVYFEGSVSEHSADLWRLPCWWHYRMPGSPRCLATCCNSILAIPPSSLMDEQSLRIQMLTAPISYKQKQFQIEISFPEWLTTHLSAIVAGETELPL